MVARFSLINLLSVDAFSSMWFSVSLVWNRFGIQCAYVLASHACMYTLSTFFSEVAYVGIPNSNGIQPTANTFMFGANIAVARIFVQCSGNIPVDMGQLCTKRSIRITHATRGWTYASSKQKLAY